MIAAAEQVRRKPSADLSIEPDDFTQPAPPRPHFATTQVKETIFHEAEVVRRPRIVVPLNVENERALATVPNPGVNQIQTDVNKRSGGPLGRRTVPGMPATRGRRALVALALILAFSGMLLATHKYVTSHWNPLATIPRLGDTFIVGREGVTTTDVNLRSEASTSNAPIGLAEVGSKVRVLSADNNWYEVQVVTHSRPKSDQYSSDRGWINKKFVRFD
jgi:uncharacterized protein YgiM (DUF1202 family)